MKVFGLILALVLLFAVANAYDYEENVVLLTESNFDEALKEFNHVLVKFYAPWCGHCKKLAPDYAKAASTLKKNDLILGKVDCTEESDLCQRYGVKGYPTLKFFKFGKDVEYTGGRTEADIVAWMLKRAGPASTEIKTTDELESFIGTHEVATVFFTDEATGPEWEAYTAVATEIETVSFAHVVDPEIKAKYDVTEGKKVVLFRQFEEEEPRVDFEGSMSDLQLFIETESIALVEEFTQENTAKIFGGSIQKHLLFMHNDKSLFPVMRESAKKFKGKALFIHVDSTSPENARVMEYFGISTEETPAMVLVDMDQQPLKKYQFSSDFTTEEITTFTTSFFNGELKPFLKSEEIPETNDEHVKVIVGKSFDDIALDSNKDVLVEFYATWCGHCKELQPKYDELAERLSGIDTLVIAKMEATENEIDHPEVDISGFPTLKLFTADGKVVDFSGAREVSDMIDFLKENCHYSFDYDLSRAEEDEELDYEEPEDEL